MVGSNPEGMLAWQWVMVTRIATVVLQRLSRSAGATKELLGHHFTSVVVSDRYSGYNQLKLEKQERCWVSLIHDLIAIAKQQDANAEIGAELLVLLGEMCLLNGTSGKTAQSTGHSCGDVACRSG